MPKTKLEEEYFMKNLLHKFPKLALSIMSCMALMLTVANTNQICFFVCHQPKPPAGMDKFRKHL